MGLREDVDESGAGEPGHGIISIGPIDSNELLKPRKSATSARKDPPRRLSNNMNVIDELTEEQTIYNRLISYAPQVECKF